MGKQNTIFDAEEFPGGPLVRGPRVSTAQGMGLTSGWGTKIPQASRCSKKKKKKLNDVEINIELHLKAVVSFKCPLK